MVTSATVLRKRHRPQPRARRATAKVEALPTWSFHLIFDSTVLDRVKSACIDGILIAFHY